MKIYVNKDYNLSIANDKAPFVQGNDNYDKLYVYIEAQQVYRDNVIPTFLFEREDGAELGYYVHDTSFNEAVNGIDYVVFQKTLSSKVLSVNGLLKINIEFNFYNGNGVVYKSKNARTSNTVTEATTVGDNILIFGNPENAIESLQESLASLNIRIEPYARFSFDENGNLIIQNSMLVGENVEAVEITTTTVNTDELNVATSSSIKDLNVTGDAIISNANINELSNDTINTNNANANSLEVYNNAFVNRMSVSGALDVKGNAVITTEDKNELDAKIENNKTDIETNTKQIATNAFNISTNKTDILTHNKSSEEQHASLKSQMEGYYKELLEKYQTLYDAIDIDQDGLDEIREILELLHGAEGVEGIITQLSKKAEKTYVEENVKIGTYEVDENNEIIESTDTRGNLQKYVDSQGSTLVSQFTSRMATHEVTTEQQIRDYYALVQQYVADTVGTLPIELNAIIGE